MGRSNSEWITLREAARRLNISAATVPKVAKLSGIRYRVVPGAWTRYHAGDVAALDAAAVRGKGVELAGVPA